MVNPGGIDVGQAITILAWGASGQSSGLLQSRVVRVAVAVAAIEGRRVGRVELGARP
jgi:hypothetical protein